MDIKRETVFLVAIIGLLLAVLGVVLFVFEYKTLGYGFIIIGWVGVMVSLAANIFFKKNNRRHP